MSKRFDALVFIGRFQPFHNGHLAAVQHALREAERLVVVVGSTDKPRTSRDPFTFEERVAMITGAVTDPGRISVMPQSDEPYNEPGWLRSVQDSVASVVGEGKKIGLIGYPKDHSSYYLKKFPTWGSIAHDPVTDGVGVINATDIRERYFRDPQSLVMEELPPSTAAFLDRFMRSEAYERIRAEDVFVSNYRAQWAGAPFPPFFVTVDSVVLQAGHVLLVKRRSHPGKGLGALPGGFVQEYEPLVDAAVRELREETRIDLPETVLRNSIKASYVFDNPYRSLRGRTITHAYLFDLGHEMDRAARKGRIELTKVKGSDDAEKASWIPLAHLDRSKMFEDHYAIVEKMIALR